MPKTNIHHRINYMSYAAVVLKDSGLKHLKDIKEKGVVSLTGKSVMVPYRILSSRNHKRHSMYPESFLFSTLKVYRSFIGSH